VEDIFENASRGDRSAEEDLQKAFGTREVLAIAETIIKKGEISLTAEQRKQFIENKRRQVSRDHSPKCHQSSDQDASPPARIDQA